MKEFVVDHEVVIEHTLSYFLGAKDLVKNVTRDFDVAFLPAGYHFYTGVLQSASYRGLKNKNKIIIVFEGKEDDKIIIYNKNIGPFLGKIRDFDKKLLSLSKKFDFLSFEDFGLDDINNQLNYLRIIFDLDQIITVFVGKNVKEENCINFLSEFDIKSDFNLVFVSDINAAGKSKNILSKNKNTGKEYFNSKFVAKDIVFRSFYYYLKSKGLSTNILAKTDSYEIFDKPKDLIFYLSALAK